MKHCYHIETLQPRCCLLANWTKHTYHLYFWPICSIMWKRRHTQNQSI